MTDLDQTSQAIGKLQGAMEQGFKDINKQINDKFGALPCAIHQSDIDSLKADRNKVIGIVAVLGMIFGLIGWFLSPVVDWLAKHILK